MDTSKIEAALNRIFFEEDQRIVFWNDPDQEFYITLGTFQLDGVNVVRLDQTGGFELKCRMEREDPQGKYLVYDPNEEPPYKWDWLLDMRLYGRSFRADRASLVLDELGLTHQRLRRHIAERRKFFDNKERIAKLKALVQPDDTEDDLDRKMMAVVLKADQAELFNLVRTSFGLFIDDDGEIAQLDDSPEPWQQIEKYDLDKPFWLMVKGAFGYEDDSPSLKSFLIRLLVTDFANSFHGELSQSLSHLVLPRSGRSNTVVCLNQWRDSSSTGASYDILSYRIGKILKIRDTLVSADIEELIDVMTFFEVERIIMSRLAQRVGSTAETLKAEAVNSITARRQAGHWAGAASPANSPVPRFAVNAVYDALASAAELFELHRRNKGRLTFDTAHEAYHAYTDTLYRFDQLYRQFCESANSAEAQNWDVLKKLHAQVEACYDQGFVDPLAMAWSDLVDPGRPNGLLKTWTLPGVSNQYEFFDKQVQPVLNEGKNRRVFVVISDAFRYESAQELTRQINGKYRLEAELGSLLGTLPSCTSLGMASLLPHKNLAYGPSGQLLADGKPTASLEQRSAILAGANGVAVRADELMSMNKADGRTFVKDKQVVYVYDNTVDSTGDDQKTEGKTFAAVGQAIAKLSTLVSFIIDSLNGNHVVVTADHGFLFSGSPLNETDKTELKVKADDAITKHKRFVLGHKLKAQVDVWHGRTSVTAKTQSDMEFLLPRGAQRFYFTGGARFVHGGAMLQEVVVPVITVRHKKDKSTRGKTEVAPVQVCVLGSTHRITTGRHRFELMQTEPVSDRIKPVTLKVAVYEGSEPVTDVQTVTFESTSGSIDERKRWVLLSLKNREYDNKAEYRLILRDAETGVEHCHVQVTIDRAFTDDF